MKKAALLVLGIVLVSLLLPFMFMQPRARASTVTLDTVNITLVPGIDYIDYLFSGLTVNTSAGSLPLTGAHLTVEVAYANGTVFSVQNVVVNSKSQISIQVPNNTQVKIFVNVTGVGVSIPVSYVPSATFEKSETTNLSVAIAVYPITFKLANGTNETVRLAVAWTYNESAAAIGDGRMEYSKTSNNVQMLPWIFDKNYASDQLTPLWPYSGYLAGLIELGPDYESDYAYWLLGKSVTVTAYSSSNYLSIVKTPPAAAWAFLNGTGLIGVWVHHVTNVGYNAGPSVTTYYLLYNKADVANDTDWLFIPVNRSTGWAVFEPWLNLSVSWGYDFAYWLSLNVNESLPVFAFPSLASKGWVYATPFTFGTTGATSISFNKTLTFAVAGSSMSVWFNGTGIKALEIIGPNFEVNNISATGVFYTNVTGGFVPIFPTSNKWPFTYGKKVVVNGKVYALALNATSTAYILPYGMNTVTPTKYAYGTYILYTPYKLSNSTSSTAYVVVKGQVRTLYGNYTVPNGTVEIIVNNGNTNVYTVNVSVKSGAFASPALALSPTTNYTYKLLYYNASSSVLSSNASNTNVVFSGDPSGFSTLTVSSTSTSTTTTSPSTSPSTGPSLGYVLLVIFIIIVIVVAVVAIGKSVEHTVYNATHKYVRKEA